MNEFRYCAVYHAIGIAILFPYFVFHINFGWQKPEMCVESTFSMIATLKTLLQTYKYVWEKGGKRWNCSTIHPKI